MTRGRGGLIAALGAVFWAVALAGCADSGPSVKEADPWHVRVDEYLSGSTSGFVRSVLEDYKVESAELDEAADRYSGCLEPHGLEPAIDNDQALYGVESRSTEEWAVSDRDLAALDKIVAHCADSTIGPVGMFYRDMRENPLALEYGPALYECLQVHGGLEADAAKALTQGVVPDPTPFAVAECLEDPFTPE